MSAPVRIGAGLSLEADTVGAVRDACAAALAPLAGAPATLLVAFASPAHWRDGTLAATLAAETGAEHAIGAMGEAIIGCGREVEEGPALAVLAAHLPGATVRATHLRITPGEGPPRLEGTLPDPPAGGPDAPAIVLADPFSFATDVLLDELTALGIPAVGGLASGGRGPGEHRLLVDGREVSEGAVVATISGASGQVVVSQGCAPIGPEMVVTDAEGAIVHQLAGTAALTKLEQIVAGLSPAERALAAQGILAGIVIDENRPDYGRGDYLMRGLHGADRASGDILVGARLRVGQTLRLHVRDRHTADTDLREALRERRARGPTAAGALLFSCNGRGRRMFDLPDHDASVLRDELGDVPTIGLFCNGEIGPVGSRNFLHGFTATAAVIGR